MFCQLAPNCAATEVTSSGLLALERTRSKGSPLSSVTVPGDKRAALLLGGSERRQLVEHSRARFEANLKCPAVARGNRVSCLDQSVPTAHPLRAVIRAQGASNWQLAAGIDRNRRAHTPMALDVGPCVKLVPLPDR